MVGQKNISDLLSAWTKTLWWSGHRRYFTAVLIHQALLTSSTVTKAARTTGVRSTGWLPPRVAETPLAALYRLIRTRWGWVRQNTNTLKEQYSSTNETGTVPITGGGQPGSSVSNTRE